MGYIGIDYLIVATCRQVIVDWEMEGVGQPGKGRSIAIRANEGDGTPGWRISGTIGRVCTWYR